MNASIATNNESRKVIYSCGKRSPWRETLLYGLCQGLSLRFFHQTGRQAGRGRCEYWVVGDATDVATVERLFGIFSEEIMDLSPKHNVGRGLDWSLAFMFGAAQGIVSRVHEVRAGENAERNEMVSERPVATRDDMARMQGFMLGRAIKVKSILEGHADEDGDGMEY